MFLCHLQSSTLQCNGDHVVILTLSSGDTLCLSLSNRVLLIGEEDSDINDALLASPNMEALLCSHVRLKLIVVLKILSSY
jgi:hypothetical protein